MASLSIIVENTPCTECGELEETHVEGKCLFGATEYRPYSSYAVRMAMSMNTQTLRLNFEIRRVVFVYTDLVGPAEYGVHIVDATTKYDPSESIGPYSWRYTIYGMYRSHLEENQGDTMFP